MDCQYIEIHNAGLFLWDTLDQRGCCFDVGEFWCNEMVDWSVDEPPLMDPRDIRWETDNQNSDFDHHGGGDDDVAGHDDEDNRDDGDNHENSGDNDGEFDDEDHQACQ